MEREWRMGIILIDFGWMKVDPSGPWHLSLHTPSIPTIHEICCQS